MQQSAACKCLTGNRQGACDRKPCDLSWPGLSKDIVFGSEFHAFHATQRCMEIDANEALLDIKVIFPAVKASKRHVAINKPPLCILHILQQSLLPFGGKSRRNGTSIKHLKWTSSLGVKLQRRLIFIFSNWLAIYEGMGRGFAHSPTFESKANMQAILGCRLRQSKRHYTALLIFVALFIFITIAILHIHPSKGN